MHGACVGGLLFEHAALHFDEIKDDPPASWRPQAETPATATPFTASAGWVTLLRRRATGLHGFAPAGRMGLEVLPGSRASPRGVGFVNCPRAIDETQLYSELAHNGGYNAKQLQPLEEKKPE